MAEGTANVGDTDFDVFFRLLPIFMIVGMIAFVFTRDPPKPPSASALKGCYLSHGAPSLRFDGSRMHFGDGSLPSMHYALSFSKIGIHLDLAQAVRLRRNRDDSWAFYHPSEGWSYRIRLVRVVDSKAYGVWSVGDADYLEFAVGDGTLLAFRPASPDMCKS